MRTLYLLLFLTSLSFVHAQVAINTDGSNPDNSAMLDVKSTVKGVLFTRMTTTEREAIATPANGLTVYDLTTQSYWYYKGAAWATIGNGIWTQNGNDIYSNITGKAGIGTTLPYDKLHLFDSVNLRILIETPDNFYAGVRTRNSQREYFMGSIGNRWSVYDNYDGSEDISVLPDGNVGIATTTPDPSAALDVNSTTKGFLSPRMSTEQRNSIVSPAEGLIIFNTSENALNVYGGVAWTSMMPVPSFECGYSITIYHSIAGGVAPVNKTVIYETVSDIPGEPAKCWITSNLGARRQAMAVDDDTEASAGWYWQFNRKQGYKHDGTTRTPNTIWITNINENSEWIAANDPCAIELGAGWRLPTNAEWTNIDATGNWTNWNGPWNSGLKLHAAGYLRNDGFFDYRGSNALYWSSSQNSLDWGRCMYFLPGYSVTTADYKAGGFSVRCLKE